MRRFRPLLVLGFALVGAGATPALASAITPLEALQAGTATTATETAFDEFLKNPQKAPSGWYTAGGDSISVAQATAQMAQPGGLTGNGYTRSPTTVTAGSPTPAQGQTIRTWLVKARAAAGRFPTPANFFPSGATGYFSVAAIAVGAPFIWQQSYYLGAILAERIGLGMDNPGITAAAVATDVLFTKRGFQAHARAAGGDTLDDPADSAIADEDVVYQWQYDGDSFERREFTDFSKCVTTVVGGSPSSGYDSTTETCRFSSQEHLNSQYAAYALALTLANAGMGHVVESQALGTTSNSSRRLMVWYATREEFWEMTRIDEQEEATGAEAGDRTISHAPTIINSTSRQAGATAITDATTATWINNQLDPAHEPGLEGDTDEDTEGTTPVSGTVNIVPPPTTVPATPAVDFSPITELDPGCKFPYGFVCYAVDFTEQFDVAADAPVFSFTLGWTGMVNGQEEGGEAPYTVDLEVMDDYMALWRGILAVVLWVGAIYLVATRMLGVKFGGDPGEAIDDVL